MLYRDIWDHKGPLIHLLFSGVYRLFGYNPVAINTLATVLLIFVAAAVYCLAWQLFDRFTAGAAATFLLLAGVFPSGQRLGPELMMQPWMVLAFVAVIAGLRIRRTSLILVGGVLAGLALQVTGAVGLHIVALLLGIAIYSLWVARRSVMSAGASVGATLGGVLLPAAGFAAYFYHLGALGNYLARPIMDNLVYVGQAIGRQVDSHPIAFLRNEVVTNPIFWLAAMCGALLIIVGTTKKYQESQEPQERLERSVLIAWLLFGAIAVTVSGRYYPHYLMHVLPPAAILAGLAAKHTYELLCQPATHNYTLALVLAAGSMVFLSLLPRIGPAVYKWQGLAGVPQPQRPAAIAGNWLKGKVAPGTSVFVWPFRAALYLNSDTKPVNRFYTYWYFEHISSGPPSTFRTHLASIWHQDLEANPPQYILLEKQYLEQGAEAIATLGVEALLQEGCVKLSDVAGYEVWRKVFAKDDVGE